MTTTSPRTSTDIVSVFVYGLANHRAECSCGWASRRRARKGRAVVDALVHAAAGDCRENWPLVYGPAK
jgi:hypothetical protein